MRQRRETWDELRVDRHAAVPARRSATVTPGAGRRPGVRATRRPAATLQASGAQHPQHRERPRALRERHGVPRRRLGALSDQAFITAPATRSRSYEERGYFEFAKAGLGVVDRVVTNFTEEDVEQLGDNVVLDPRDRQGDDPARDHGGAVSHDRGHPAPARTPWPPSRISRPACGRCSGSCATPRSAAAWPGRSTRSSAVSDVDTGPPRKFVPTTASTTIGSTEHTNATEGGS